MRILPMLAAAITVAALLTACSNTGECEGAALRPAPVAQAAPIAPERPSPPRPAPPRASVPKPNLQKPRTVKPSKPKSKPGAVPHHRDLDFDDCDDD
jgi:hypothetical protein